MAKKKLSIKTKLQKVPSPENAAEKLNLVKRPKTYPRAYRWRHHDLEIIEDLIEKTNNLTNYKVDATKLIRGSLYIASKTKPEKLLNMIMEAERKSVISRVK